MSGPIRIVIVDDSTFVRRALRRVLEAEADFEMVGEARDGSEGMELVERLQPDVATLDLQMPVYGGLELMRRLRRRVPTRFIVVSTFTQEGTDEALRALEEGAVDFLDKTSVRNRMEFTALGAELVRKIRIAAGIEAPVPETVRPAPPLGRPEPSSESAAGIELCALVVVGASTGGPPAVRRLLRELPATLPAAVVVAQHMPPGFTEGFARRLNQYSALRVLEAEDGQALQAGHAYVIPSGCELRFEAGKAGEWLARVQEAGAGDQHRPSVDRTFAEAAAFAGPRTVAVVLTGMGVDGAVGAVAVQRAGGVVLVQDADSCVIYGMPRAVQAAVDVAGEGPPEALAAKIVHHVGELAVPGDGDGGGTTED